MVERSKMVAVSTQQWSYQVFSGATEVETHLSTLRPTATPTIGSIATQMRWTGQGQVMTER